jgi:hypothetical protein
MLLRGAANRYVRASMSGVSRLDDVYAFKLQLEASRTSGVSAGTGLSRVGEIRSWGKQVTVAERMRTKKDCAVMGRGHTDISRSH